MSCATFREMMVEAVYGELDPAAAREFGAHVAGCAECAALYGEMRSTLAAMNGRRRPDPGEEYWNTYYARLEERMGRERSVVDGAKFTARWRSNVSWGYRVAAAVAVLALGVWIGRSSLTHGPPGEQPIVVSENTATDSLRGKSAPADSLERPDRDGIRQDAIEGPATRDTRTRKTGGVRLASADVRAREYIERSQVLLLALVNASPDSSTTSTADFASQRERAGMLVREATVLRDDLPGGENRRLRELVTDLQMILREIANLESQNDLDAVQIIRNRVDREGVLLQIDVEQMREDGDTVPSRSKRSGAID